MSRVLSPEAVISYPNVFVPRPQDPDDPDSPKKYSAAFVFPAGTDLKELKTAVIQEAKERWGSKLGKKASLKPLETSNGPALFLVSEDEKLKLRLPWREDGEEKGYPEGSVFINARSQRKPQIVTIYPSADDPSKPAKLEDESKLYAGAIVKVSLDVYAYDKNGNKGVTFGLGNIQLIRDGERLDGSVAAENEFEADQNAVADLSDLTDDPDEDPGEDTPAPEAGGDDDISDLLG